MYLRLLILLPLVLLTISCSSGKHSKTASQKLRVMSYNIHHANPPLLKDSIDIPAIVRAIASQDPHLVALQEVDANTRRSGQGNQAEMIAEALGMQVYFGKALDFDGGEYGTAILSRFPISETITYLLPGLGGPGAEPRVLTTAKIHLPSGQQLIFGSTHLDHRGDPQSRLLQVREILALAEKDSLPWILAGDLNAKPDSEEMKLLESEFRFTCKECPGTFPGEAPDRVIDYIAVRGKLEVVSHLVVDEPHASDHRPVFAVLRVLQKAAVVTPNL